MLPELCRGPPGLLSSRVLQLPPTIYTITLYTPQHQEISWEVFAKKSADIFSYRISFITISKQTTKCTSWFSEYESRSCKSKAVLISNCPLKSNGRHITPKLYVQFHCFSLSHDIKVETLELSWELPAASFMYIVCTLADSGFLYQGGVKSTVFWLFEDLKFKISEGYNWRQENFNFGPQIPMKL